MNGMLQCLNISLATWPELRMTREIQPVKNSSNSSICFASRVACFASWNLRASREILIFIKSSLNFHTQPLH